MGGADSQIIGGVGGDHWQGGGCRGSGRLDSWQIVAGFTARRWPTGRGNPQSASRHYRFRYAYALFEKVGDGPPGWPGLHALYVNGLDKVADEETVKQR